MSMPRVDRPLMRRVNVLYPLAMIVSFEARDTLFNRKYPSFPVVVEMEVFINRTVAPDTGCWVNLSKTCPITSVSFWAETMQHPPELVRLLIEKWEEGYDVVYTCRAESKNTSLMKRKTSNAFYSIFNRFSDVQIEKGTADFRLMDRAVVDVFKRFRENDMFIRGIVKWMGFKQIHIDYEPNDRFSGTSKYTMRRMLQFAVHVPVATSR